MSPAEDFFAALRAIRGIGTDETSGYPALAGLLDAVGEKLRPKVRAIIHPKNTGAGIADGGFFSPDQLRHADQSALLTLLPARGALEVKPLKTDLATLAREPQVLGYLEHYGQILLTNYRAYSLWHWENGKPVAGETFTLAESDADFWALASSDTASIGERLCDYLQRVLLSRAPLAEPKVLAAFLASYAREARARIGHAPLSALGSVRTALEESLGIQFTDERGLHFFQSTFVQTLFYGVFSAWVLWHEQQPARGARFDWRTAQFHIGLPVLRRLFQQVADPHALRAFRIDEVLDWAGATLDRVDRAAFFQRFELREAVQYFYEPFLEAFDPALRKDFGVWYTPPEIVKYMVERVDRALRDDLHIADGLADERVVVLDPCCGTGTYLIEVLRHIHARVAENYGAADAGLQTAKAARERIFGFELLPAPYVVAHLQLDLVLRRWQAGFDPDQDERAAVYLTNALTGWEPPREPKHLLFPEFEQERDAADHVKREARILVILGNPPYDGFAGLAATSETDREERALSEAYRETSTPGLPKPQGQGLNDLYVRFYRMAERRVTQHSGQGIVCFISNYSWLDGLSHPGMRERFLGAFDRIAIDCLNGDKYKTGKRTPDGQSDPSVFSTPFNREGIQVGTAIATLVRREKGASDRRAKLAFRHFWGTQKREELLASLGLSAARNYERLAPEVALGLPFVPMTQSAAYSSWPLILELLPTGFSGVKTARDADLVSIDEEPLRELIAHYFDSTVTDEKLRAVAPSLMKRTTGYDPHSTRVQLLKRGIFAGRFVRLCYRPFDIRWLYWDPETRLLDRNRPEFFPQIFPGNLSIILAQRTRKGFEPPVVSPRLVGFHVLENTSVCFPLYLVGRAPATSVVRETPDMFDNGGGGSSGPEPNLTPFARDYLTRFGCEASDLFHHIVAILHAPAYCEENAGVLRQDWPRIPLPKSATLLRAGAALGREVAALLDPETPVQGVTAGTKLRSGISGIAELHMTRPKIKPDLAVAAGWGRRQQGAIMPGLGRTDSYSTYEDPTDLSRRKDFQNIFLNETTYWRGVPQEVWDYTLGGYPVLKKWLSYRESEILGRALRPEEAREFTHIARRISALLLLQPALDAHYRQTAADAA